MSKSNGLTAELLEEIVAAFNRRDIEAITGYFAEDGVFVTARGSEPWGRRIVGPQAIGKYLEERFKVIPNMRWVDGRNWVVGNRGVSEWRVVGTSVDGEEINWLGCDIWEFRDSKIVYKDTYWKYVDRQKAPADYL
ncbi:MAG: hypothetical protein QOK29_111 [Rhodospirillaceae bacterium]|jgi:ketosteroid isomerase-like protein|nr:hypothetical protein [Rhodospirillaceae bacterium]